MNWQKAPYYFLIFIISKKLKNDKLRKLINIYPSLLPIAGNLISKARDVEMR